MGVLHHQNLEVNLVEIQEAFEYYFVEKNESKKKKLLMNKHLITHSQFINRIVKSSDVIAHYYLYNVLHLKALYRVMNIYFPEEFKEKQQEEIKQQEMNRAEVEAGK